MTDFPVALLSLAAPTLAFVGKLLFERRDPGELRSLRRNVELYNSFPEDFRAPLGALLQRQAEAYSATRIRKSGRRLHGSTLAALIFVGCATALVTWPLVGWALVFWPAWILAGLVALFGVALMLSGVGQLYEYEGEPRTPRKKRGE